MFDSATGKMCKHCWNQDRQAYLGSLGEDIEPFAREDNSEPCTSCDKYLEEESEKYHVNEENMFHFGGLELGRECLGSKSFSCFRI